MLYFVGSVAERG